MKRRILVVDDDWQKRAAGYERLEAELNRRAPALDLVFDVVRSPDQLLTMVRENSYCGAIIDAVLESSWQSYTIREALDELGGSIPFAVLSAWWDQTNASQIEHALKRPNWSAFVHWRDINPAGDGQIDYAASAILRMVYDDLGINGSVKLLADEPIRMVHISDIQSGGFDSTGLKLEATGCADRILSFWNDSPPTFLAFTGDVTEFGSPGQYAKALDWIEYFVERLGMAGLPSSQVLYVPGNHDVNISLSAASRLELYRTGAGQAPAVRLTEEVKQPELLHYAYAPYRQFLAQICDRKMLSARIDDSSLAWTDLRFRHLGIAFYGINTAQPANPNGLPDRKVSADALAQIKVALDKYLRNRNEDTPVLVGLGHHCPISASGDGGVENPEVFEKFFSSNIKTALFLHGHTHKFELAYTDNSEYRVVRSCAATLTKTESARPPDTLRGFNLLEFRRTQNRIRELRTASFAWLGSGIIELPKGRMWQIQPDGMFRDTGSQSH